MRPKELVRPRSRRRHLIDKLLAGLSKRRLVPSRPVEPIWPEIHRRPGASDNPSRAVRH